MNNNNINNNNDNNNNNNNNNNNKNDNSSSMYRENMSEDIRCIDACSFRRDELYNMMSTSKLIRLSGQINGIDALMLIDSGSSGDFISTSFVQKHNIETMNSNSNNYSDSKNRNTEVELAN